MKAKEVSVSASYKRKVQHKAYEPIEFWGHSSVTFEMEPEDEMTKDRCRAFVAQEMRGLMDVAIKEVENQVKEGGSE